MARRKTSGHQAPASSDNHQLRYRLVFRCLDLLEVALRVGIPWGVGALCVLWISRSVDGLAGRHTYADVGFRLLADIRVGEWVAYILGTGGVAYGLRQRKLLKQNIERLSAGKQRLEREIDPGRTSSGLTTKGETNPEDRR